MANVLEVTVGMVRDSYEGPGEIHQSDGWLSRKIDRAVRLLLRNCPSILERSQLDPGAEDYLDPEFVADKVIECVLRLVRNPQGMEAEGEGDYNYRLSKLVASGTIWYPRSDFIELGCVPQENVPKTVRAKATPGWAWPQ